MAIKKIRYKETSIAEIPKREKLVVFNIPDQLETVQTKISNPILKSIGDYIMEGLTEKEACILANFDFNTFEEMKGKDIRLQEFIHKQFIKLKHKHLRIIQNNPSDKNSQWILEKVFPDEYGSKRKNDTPSDLNVLASIIRTIQHDTGNNIIRDTVATDITRANDLAPVLDVAQSLG